MMDEIIMSNLTSSLSCETSISSTTTTTTTMNNTSSLAPPPPKRKRGLPGNPDPDAEVIALSPKSLVAKNRFICEICKKGFQRDQNLQLHRRGHNLPWKLKQRANNMDEIVRKKVYVCPELTCVHHEPSRALGDLTGIKKHFCRKHGEKKWKCDKCSKRYAVLSDWKAHSKICGTREYRCDCGTLFSRRDSFMTHRAFCDALAAAEESGRYNSIINNHHGSLFLPPSSTSSHLLPPIHVSFPPWLSSSSPQPHLFATVDDTPTTTTTSLPHMSATALLQKAAEMGTCSSRDQGQHDDIMIINSLSTRDFLGLTTFSHKDLINMAGHLGFDHHQQQHHHDYDYDHHHLHLHQNQTPW